MDILSAETFTVIARTVAIFLWALVLLRLLGRRRLAHLTYIDLLLIIAFGSAVGDVMIYPESTARFITSIIAITTVAVIVRLLDELSSRFSYANKLIDGTPRLIISQGEIVGDVLNRENLTEADLLSLLREKEVDAIHKVRWAYIEPDGEISVSIYKKYR